MKTFESKFHKYHELNEQVYPKFREYALEAVKSGADAMSGWLIINAMRWHSLVGDVISDDYKLPNDYVGIYTRAFALEYPEHGHVFKYKQTKRDLDKLAQWLVKES